MRPEALDVIYIMDDYIKPPGAKYVVCVEPDLGLYLRINSDGWRDGSVEVIRDKHAPFLHWDSFIECGDVLELDEFVIQDALDDKGILGSISDELCQEIADSVQHCSRLNMKDRLDIRAALGC